ncbi:MAG: hypothetical protein GY751_25925 [Bacteroidetes bacterium]|nr:hypothetical protein [Bacteroidota bacterium]
MTIPSQAIKNNDTILPNKMVQKLHTPIVSRDDDMYAMGWAIREIGNQKVSTHSGSDQSIFAMMSIDQNSGKGLVVATNIGGQRAELALVNITLEILH